MRCADRVAVQRSTATAPRQRRGHHDCRSSSSKTDARRSMSTVTPSTKSPHCATRPAPTTVALEHRPPPCERSRGPWRRRPRRQARHHHVPQRRTRPVDMGELSAESRPEPVVRIPRRHLAHRKSRPARWAPVARRSVPVGRPPRRPAGPPARSWSRVLRADGTVTPSADATTSPPADPATPPQPRWAPGQAPADEQG